MQGNGSRREHVINQAIFFHNIQEAFSNWFKDKFRYLRKTTAFCAMQKSQIVITLCDELKICNKIYIYAFNLSFMHFE